MTPVTPATSLAEATDCWNLNNDDENDMITRVLVPEPMEFEETFLEEEADEGEEKIDARGRLARDFPRWLHLLFGVALLSVSVMMVHLAFPSSSSTPSNPVDVESSLATCHGDCFLLLPRRHTGLGSNLMYLFSTMVYLRKVYQRTKFFIDVTMPDDQVYYQRDGLNFLRGWFTPKVGLIETTDQYSLVDAYLPDGITLEQLHGIEGKDQMAWNDVYTNRSSGSALWASETHEYRSAMHTYFTSAGRGGYKQLYRDLVPLMCANLQFNEVARSEIENVKANFAYPVDFAERPTVGFHVRRTDKVVAQSRTYMAAEYVDTLLNVTGHDLDVFDYCFLATDDDTVVGEMQDALTTAGVTCQLVYSPNNSSTDPGSLERRYQADGALVFMTEFSLLLQADYFVGTFNSNVGALASVLRACPELSHPVDDHYARSYGVDADDWFLRHIYRGHSPYAHV